MVHVLSIWYKMQELSHAADVKSKTEETGRFQRAQKQDVVFKQGDCVYYYHEPPKQGVISSKGPATLVRVDASLVLVQQGGHIKRLRIIAVQREADVVDNRSDSELLGDGAEDPSEEASGVAVQIPGLSRTRHR